MPESSALRLGKDDLILDIPKASHGSDLGGPSLFVQKISCRISPVNSFWHPPFHPVFWWFFQAMCPAIFFRITPSPAGVVGSAALQLAAFGQNLRDACALRARRAAGTGTHQVSRLGRAVFARKIRKTFGALKV